MNSQAIVQSCRATKLNDSGSGHGQGRNPGGPLQRERTPLLIIFLQGVSLTGNGDSLVIDRRCKKYTAPRTHHTHFFFSRVAQAHMVHFLLCVVSPTNSHRLARMSCFAPCLIHLYLLHSALRPLPLCFSLRTGPTPAPWTLVWPFCRTVSAHRPGRSRCVQGTSLCIFYGSCTGLHQVTSAWPGEVSLGWVGWCWAECFINQTG